MTSTELDSDMDTSADASWAILRAKLQAKGLNISDDDLPLYRVAFAHGAQWTLDKIKVTP